MRRTPTRREFLQQSGALTATMSGLSLPAEAAQKEKTMGGTKGVWTLLYDRPAEAPEGDSPQPWQNSAAWVRALPMGNGKLGGMVYGGVAQEHIQLNEISLWSGNPQDADNPDALTHLPEIRRLLQERQYTAAQKLTYEKLVCKGAGSGGGNGAKVPYGSYQTLGDLRLDFAGGQEAKEYRRKLDLETAMASVRYKQGGVSFLREIFVSNPAQALVMRLTASKPGSLSFTVTLTRPEMTQTKAVASDTLEMHGQLSGEPGMKFVAMLRVVNEGGTVTRKQDTLVVQNADAVTIVLTAETDFRGNPYLAIARKNLNAVSSTPYPLLKKQQTAWHRKFFGRVALDFGGQEKAAIPTDVRLNAVRAGNLDPHLDALYFQYGRYLLLASSAPNGLPANLQGLWASKTQTPWNGDYHTNINLQMNYWPAEVANLTECHQPLLNFIGTLVEPGRQTAKIHYGCAGWVVHTITNVWGYTSPGEHPSWGQFPAAGGWLCRHLWEHYLYSGDRKYLAAVYPILREAARFYKEFLITDTKTGWLVTAPSNSPENTFRTADGQTAAVCMGPSMDMQIIRELFASCVEAARLLEKDAGFAAELQNLSAKLVPHQIGKHGQLQEWLEDFDETEPGHRHISHLYALHPSAQITLRGTPALAKAARISLERRLANGGGHTGWSRAWILNFWARLEEGEKAWENLQALLAKSTLPNLFDDHPPFQIDGNFGGAAGIAEMLLQSHAGEIHLLPALPKAWKTGFIKGLRARGGYEVAMQWKEERLEEATLHTASRGVCRVRASRPLTVTENGTKIKTQTPEPNVCVFLTERGKRYTLR